MTLSLSCTVLSKTFITKELEYKAGLNRKIKFACIATYVFLSDESLLT